MNRIAVTSSATHYRIRRAEAWLENRASTEEVLIIGATLDASNELTRRVVKKKGAAFGWHRLSLAQLAFAIAAPVLAARNLTPLSRIGADALAARTRAPDERGGAARPSRVDCEDAWISEGGRWCDRGTASGEIGAGSRRSFCANFAPLISAFDVELKKSGLTDWAGVLAVASEAPSSVGDKRPRLVGLPVLLLDVPIRSEAELVFVHSLAEAATEFLATAPAGDQSTLCHLRERLRVEIEDVDRESAANESDVFWMNASGLEKLQRQLFKAASACSCLA